MMKSLLLIQLVLLPMLVSAQVSQGSLQFLSDVHREISGLLDAYLEGIPECPPRADTPIRLWVIDLAWLRAEAALEELRLFDPAQLPVPDSVWNGYLQAAQSYFATFTRLQQLYHASALPDSSACILMENSIITADSIWQLRETDLYQSL